MGRFWPLFALALAVATAAGCVGDGVATPQPQTDTSGLTPTPGVADTNQECSAIIAATRAYLKERHTVVPSFAVEVQKVEGDYAVARVIPPPGVTDPAWVYLSRQGGTWAALGVGTYFELPPPFPEPVLPLLWPPPAAGPYVCREATS